MRAKKSLGQNFLRDQTIIKRIIDALDLGHDETVIEIGPGQGALTEQLFIDEAKVIAIEFDRDMISLLHERFGSLHNFHLINEDALNVDFSDVLKANAVDAKAKLIANLPYNISTPILQRLMDQRHLFSSLVLMFQREVVERITAKAGGKERGFLSVMVENTFNTEYLFDVPPQAFQPVPKVWSAVVRLTPKSSLIADEALFRQIISFCFLQKRKTILNNLKTRFPNAAVFLEQCEIDGMRRAETLTLCEWVKLVSAIKRAGSSIDVRP
ncbi:MAG: ribosomal RNA small subunit methyltransferase A [Chloracidobacterium sp.]|nr:ribosomal RNA small subunit methyltransferase A [Chloracidobacterium sp.]